MDEKIDKIASDIGAIKVTLAVQAEQLKEHMRRSDLLEIRVEQVDSSLKPMQRHIDMVSGALKFAGILAAIASFVGGVVKIWQVLHF